ncbi:unnamed protein product, partial [Didymodactylos carnosus]
MSEINPNDNDTNIYKLNVLKLKLILFQYLSKIFLKISIIDFKLTSLSFSMTNKEYQKLKIYISQLIDRIPKRLLGEFLLNLSAYDLESFDRLFPNIDTRNYWRLHLCRLTLQNTYWLNEIDYFLARDYFNIPTFEAEQCCITNLIVDKSNCSNRNNEIVNENLNCLLCPEKYYYFTVHFYCHKFYERDLIVEIIGDDGLKRELNVLVIPLKFLNRKLKQIRYVLKQYSNHIYYCNNLSLKLIIDQIENTLWFSYINELYFDMLECSRWID